MFTALDTITVEGNNNEIIIRCSNDLSDKSVMQKKTITDENLLNGFKNTVTTVIPNSEIPNEIPGFQFESNNTCNPCQILNSIEDSIQQRCPFRLNYT